jgi:hypothetical protein
MIESLYLETDGETWSDAGSWTLSLTTKRATLTRIRKPIGYLPGAIDQTKKISLSRETWDSGVRRVYPRSAGVPLVFFASGAKLPQVRDG